MDDKVIEFTSLLRQNGLRVSVSEDMDSFQAVKVLGLGDRIAFKDALRATMIKRSLRRAQKRSSQSRIQRGGCRVGF